MVRRMLAHRESAAPVARLAVAPAGKSRGPASFVGSASQLSKLVTWLASRRPFTITLACGYVALVALTHDLMQQPAYWAQGRLSHRSWNNLVAGVCLPVLVGICLWVAVRLRRHVRPAVAGVYLAITILLAIVSFKTLLVMNIEVVHFPQYAILAIILFPVTFRFMDTIILTTLGGLLDEAFQYFCLYADRGIHFDFNDVILNTIGAGFGLVLLYTAIDEKILRRAGSGFSFRALIRSPVLLGSLTAVGAGLMLAQLGVIRMLSGGPETAWAIVLRRGGPSTMYWTPTTWGKTYHEVHPLEWLLVSALLFALYTGLDLVGRSAERQASDRSPTRD